MWEAFGIPYDLSWQGACKLHYIKISVHSCKHEQLNLIFGKQRGERVNRLMTGQSLLLKKGRKVVHVLTYAMALYMVRNHAL